MKASKGFTLIELLVVIAIIALLMAIVVPGLRAAKLKAQLVIDMSNLSGLAKAWFMYSQNFDGELMGGNAPGNAGGGVAGSWTRAPYFTWVDYPISKSNPAQYAGADFDYQEEILGIENGLMFDYVGKAEMYHCAADKRYLSPPARSGAASLHGGYRSYSMPGGARGGTWNATLGRYAATGANFQYVAVTTFSQIKSPGNKYIFVEENDGRGLNAGPWDQDMRQLTQPSSTWRWVDVPAVWHMGRSSFGFADGHADAHKWNDPDLIPAAEEGVQYVPVSPAGVEDFAFILHGFPFLELP